MSTQDADAARAELAEVRAALERDCNATSLAGITPGRGYPLVDHVARLQARLRLDHDEKCSVVVAKLRTAEDGLRRLREATTAALDAWNARHGMERTPGEDPGVFQAREQRAQHALEEAMERLAAAAG